MRRRFSPAVCLDYGNEVKCLRPCHCKENSSSGTHNHMMTAPQAFYSSSHPLAFLGEKTSLYNITNKEHFVFQLEWATTSVQQGLEVSQVTRLNEETQSTWTLSTVSSQDRREKQFLQCFQKCYQCINYKNIIMKINNVIKSTSLVFIYIQIYFKSQAKVLR